MAGFDLGDIVAHLKMEMGDFTNSLNVARNEIEATSSKFDGLAKAGGAMKSVGTAMTASITAPVVALGVSAVKTTTQFNAAMSKVQGLSGATGKDLAKLRDTAKEMGATTMYSATEAADALGYMALAGWDANESTSALPGVLDLAAASGMDLAAASDLCTDYMSAFGMKASEAGRMADVLAYAQANSNTTTEQLGEAFKNCAVNANAFGMDVEQTTAVLGKLADQGLKGSEAGTALNAVFRDMSSKMEDGAIKIGEASVKITDANGNFLEMAEIVKQVSAATDGMSESEKMVALQSTFTADSIKAMGILTGATGEEIDKFTDKLYGAEGAAKKMADTMNDNLAGDVNEMKSAFESMQIAIGEKLDPILRTVTQSLTKLFTAFGNLPAPVLSVLMVLASLLAILGPIIFIIGQLMISVKGIYEGFKMLKTLKMASIFTKLPSPIGLVKSAFLGLKNVIMTTLIPALQSLWGFMLANPITLVIAVIGALVGAFIYLWNNCEGFKQFWINLWESIKSAASQFGEWCVNFCTVTLPNAWNGFLTWLSGLPERIAYWLGFAIGKVAQWGVDMWNKAVEAGTNFVTGFITWIKGLPGKIWTWLVNTVTKVLQWRAQMIARAREAAINFVSNVVNFIRQLPGKVWTWLSNAIAKARQFVSDMKTKAKEAATGFITNITNGLKSLPSKLMSIGKDAVSGLWNGIKNSLGGLKNNITNFCSNVVNGFKKGFNSHSPSRRMRDEVGKWIPAGIKVGIEGNIKPLMKTVKSLADNVVSSVNMPELLNSMNISTGNVSTRNIVQMSGMQVAMSKLIKTVQDSKSEIDYNKMAYAFQLGAQNVDSTIYMDHEVVGKKTAPTVNKASKLAKQRLNRLEGKFDE